MSKGADQATTGLMGGLRLPLIPGISGGIGKVSEEFHKHLIQLTIALVALDVSAALQHQFVDRMHGERSVSRD